MKMTRYNGVFTPNLGVGNSKNLYSKFRVFGSTGDLVSPRALQNRRFRCTTAEINAGKVLIPPMLGHSIRLVDCVMIAYGGNASGATTVDILGTQNGASVKLVAAAVAGLTQSAVLRAGTANSAVLPNGASFTECDPGTAISIAKTGSNLATAAGVDVILTYQLS